MENFLRFFRRIFSNKFVEAFCRAFLVLWKKYFSIFSNLLFPGENVKIKSSDVKWRRWRRIGKYRKRRLWKKSDENETSSSPWRFDFFANRTFFGYFLSWGNLKKVGIVWYFHFFSRWKIIFLLKIFRWKWRSSKNGKSNWRNIISKSSRR